MRRLAALALVLAGACRAKEVRAPGAFREVASNVTRADYAGSATCRSCHEEIARAFDRAPMHNMTRLVETAAVHAPFAGERFRLMDDEAVMETVDGQRRVRIRSRFGDHDFRVTKVIGGRQREDFAGVEEGTSVERVLPVTWVIGARAWRYKGYSVMTPERPGLKPGAVWAKTCIFCHNTKPHLDDILGTLVGPGARPFQGIVVDPLLPPERRFTFEVTDPAGLSRALREETRRLGAEVASAAQAVEVVRARFDAGDLVEIGIGCEACHGGSRAHAEHPHLLPTFEPKASFLRVRTPGAPTRAQWINRACARCHQVLFTRYPWTWEGGTRARAPGGSHINSGEARDLLLGGCASQLACSACHDPHAPDHGARLRDLEGPAGDALCTGCHPALSGDAAVRAHTHHTPGSPGARCLACHMPRKNMGLDNRLTRYHRIGSPTERARVEGDRPLECALCHADRPVGALVAAMEAFWGRTYDRRALERLYGSLDAEPLEATLARGKPHEQATALGVLAEVGPQLGADRARRLAPRVAAQLEHGTPIVRYYVGPALAALVGRAPEIDLFQDRAAIRAAAARYLAALGLAPVSAPAATAVSASGGDGGEK